MAKSKKDFREIDWEECFGKSKNHNIFLVKSGHEPMRFAAQMASLFQREFSFMVDHAPLLDKQEITFPTYFADLDEEKGINVIIMANHTPLPAPEPVANFNPLESLSLFDENFFFFNDVKPQQRLFFAPFRNYDYMLIVNSDRDASIEDLRELLKKEERLMSQDASALLLPEIKNQSKQRISVLKNLIEYFDVMMNKIREERIQRKTNYKTIPMSNHVHRRFQIDQVITSSLFQREDV